MKQCVSAARLHPGYTVQIQPEMSETCQAGRMDSGMEPECSPGREAERRRILAGIRSQNPVREAERR